MNDLLVPPWIKREKAKQNAARLHAESTTQKQLADTLTIKAEGPAFWQQLLRELALNTEALSELNIRGQMASVSRSEYEEAYRVEVVLVGLNPKQTYTDVFYSKESTVIRTHTLEGTAHQFYLCVRPEGGIGAWSDDQMRLLTPEQTAQAIVKRMADLIRS
jgi:hypothetical protein